MKTLKDLRRAAKLTQQDAANALGVGQCSICAWEIGTARPTLDKLRAIASLYGCSLEAVVDAIVGKEAKPHDDSIQPG